MNFKEVQKRVKYIKKISYDHEYAHSLEDDLHLDFIYQISRTGNENQKKLAREILKTENINFPRLKA